MNHYTITANGTHFATDEEMAQLGFFHTMMDGVAVMARSYAIMLDIPVVARAFDGYLNHPDGYFKGRVVIVHDEMISATFGEAHSVIIHTLSFNTRIKRETTEADAFVEAMMARYDANEALPKQWLRISDIPTPALDRAARARIDALVHDHITPPKEGIMTRIRKFLSNHRKAITLVALIVFLLLVTTGCQTKVSKYGVQATWQCKGKGTYEVTIVNNHKTEAWDVSTQADPYIVLLTPNGGTEIQTHPLPPSGRPWVKVYGPSGGTDQTIMPDNPMVCK